MGGGGAGSFIRSFLLLDLIKKEVVGSIRATFLLAVNFVVPVLRRTKSKAAPLVLTRWRPLALNRTRNGKKRNPIERGESKEEKKEIRSADFNLETNRESFDQETTPDLSGRRSR